LDNLLWDPTPVQAVVSIDRATEPKRQTNYGSVGVAIHWATAVVVLFAFVYSPGGSEQRIYSAARAFERQLHETLGIAVFALAIARVIWRFTARMPDRPPMPLWMAISSRTIQAALYVLLFALPITAVTGAWLEGHPLTMLAGLEIKPLIGESHPMGAIVASIHTWLGDAIMWLTGVHSLAGLYHHFVLKDAVLGSMLPRRPNASRLLR
jgi:cytochrome b561